MDGKLERVEIYEDMGGEYVEIRYYSSFHVDGKLTFFAKVLLGSGEVFVIDAENLDLLESKVKSVIPASVYVRKYLS